jgi:phosphoribosylformimino-5-aminoimidazole carboxamide ribotide isomerase
MIAMPAIDLRDGACVQLVGGSFAHERVREADPLRVAERFREQGFSRMHVVDLDAAMGTGSNATTIRALLEVKGLTFQVGGGLRSDEAIARARDLGASTVVVGTRALSDHAWLTDAAARWPDRIVVAVDVRNGVPVSHGWTRASGLALSEALARLAPLPLAGVLVTCVDVEGRMNGPDLDTTRRAREGTAHPLIASGGIATMDHLRALRALGASAAVIGMALYTGTLDPRATAEEFGP